MTYSREYAFSGPIDTEFQDLAHMGEGDARFPRTTRQWRPERRLRQILLILLSNAIKFTKLGGHLSLNASLDGGDAICLTVSDTGIGMNKKELAKAMTEFGQVESGLSRKYEGTGLGLPLTKWLVELHGGTFEIDSEKGEGTTATVRFSRERTVSPS